MEAQLQAGRSFKRMIGLELAGPHAQRTALVVLDFYPHMRRLVVSQVLTQLGAHENFSSDEHLLHSLKELYSEVHEDDFMGICTQAPLSLPPFFRETPIRNKEERWLNELWDKTKPKPNPFVPYLNRPIDVWLRYFTPEKFLVSEAMGANFAPLTSRALFLKERLPEKFFECSPRATMSRLVQSLELSRYWPKLYSDVERGMGVRQDFFERLFQKLPQFFGYEGDIETLIVEISSFQAFLSALSLFLHTQDQCDKAPEGFPSSASWILLPRQRIRWEEIFKSPKTTVSP